MSEDRQEINVRMPRTLYLALRDEAHVSFRSMNFDTLPSESHVMSTRVAGWVGRSFNRWMGTMGNIDPSAQWSSSDWKTEKLQMYWSAS